MIDIENKTDLEIDFTKLETILKSLTKKEIELIITDNDEIQEINKEYRGKDYPTDVLSFPYEEMPFSPLGSIVISKNFVEEKAQEFGHSIQDEFTLLFIHGLLHVMGYDHEIDNGEMRTMEEKLINKFSLPKSLIVRTEGQ
ncbi:rRNA maturation RNase YbeY [Sulfurimonas sp. C5]|uniref:rRNA maturation RNase YbeY n=1 Tax=Sulfurimonas sp. C5 TaxID=3036947 RepID=UPI002453C8FB|nr:rRNA maturation RNase YbeY [Sulfurimonas sp. C5]MDH4943911.1 rRNA maturation RNase YbeY [Sulfurimonas sp. C5]